MEINFAEVAKKLVTENDASATLPGCSIGPRSAIAVWQCKSTSATFEGMCFLKASYVILTDATHI